MPSPIAPQALKASTTFWSWVYDVGFRVLGLRASGFWVLGSMAQSSRFSIWSELVQEIMSCPRGNRAAFPPGLGLLQSGLRSRVKASPECSDLLTAAFCRLRDLVASLVQTLSPKQKLDGILGCRTAQKHWGSFAKAG